MATLRDIKSRIIGVKSTQQITKAMKMVAAARLRRAQENMMNARPYSRKIAELLSDLMRIEKEISNPLFAEREVKKVAVILVTSDRGLCGGFNMNVIRRTQELFNEEYKEFIKEDNLTLYPVGKKGFDYFKNKNVTVGKVLTGIFSDLRFENASSLMSDLTQKFISGEIDKVVVVYNEFVSVVQQKIQYRQLLPIKMEIPQKSAISKEIQYIYEPDKKEIINSILPRFLNAQMWQIFLESYAAELGARMTAMDMASENAKELIRTLQIKFNKERQAAITKEILEIVSGANALKGS